MKRFELTWKMIEGFKEVKVASHSAATRVEVFYIGIPPKISYSDMATALEIILQCQTFAPGVFEETNNGWRRAGSKESR